MICVGLGGVASNIRRTIRLPRALRQWSRQKYSCVLQKVTNVHQKKGNEHDKSERNTRSRSFMRRYRYCTISGLLQKG